MAGGRRTIPLFDLLSQGGNAAPAEAPARPSKPVVRVELKPQERSVPRSEPARVTPAEGTAAFRPPVNVIYIGVAVVAALVIVAYIAGAKIGARNEAIRVEKEMGGAFRDRPSVSEPAGIAPAADERVQLRPDRAAFQANPGAEGARLATNGGAGRSLSGDPRQSGLNYLALAVLPKADADAAAAFLTQNGVEALPVPLDAQGNEVNNPGPAARYRLYVLPGITREQYSSNQTAKTNLEAKVAQLGQVWQKQHRGSSNFASPEWRKMK